MSNHATVVAERGAELTAESSAASLAQFFPTATPVRLPVVMTEQASGLSQPTVIEYGTAREVLFACALPLEFGDRVRLCNADGSLNAEALVVAIQFHGGRTAVAARFAHEVPNWIVKQ